jgi:hypothetical protein
MGKVREVATAGAFRGPYGGRIARTLKGARRRMEAAMGRRKKKR